MNAVLWVLNSNHWKVKKEKVKNWPLSLLSSLGSMDLRSKRNTDHFIGSFPVLVPACCMEGTNWLPKFTPVTQKNPMLIPVWKSLASKYDTTWLNENTCKLNKAEPKYHHLLYHSWVLKLINSLSLQAKNFCIFNQIRANFFPPSKTCGMLGDYHHQSM